MPFGENETVGARVKEEDLMDKLQEIEEQKIFFLGLLTAVEKAFDGSQKVF